MFFFDMINMGTIELPPSGKGKEKEKLSRGLDEQIPKPLSDILTDEQREFIRLVENAKSRRESGPVVADTLGRPTTGISTIDYCGVEVVESPIVGRNKITLKVPQLYLGGEVRENGIHMDFARFREDEGDRIIQLLRSANPAQTECKDHLLHPQLAHPQIRGKEWSTWRLVKGDLTAEFDQHRPSIDLVMAESEPYLRDDLNMVFLACGMGFELRAFCNLFREKFPNMKITGTDFNTKLLGVARELLHEDDEVTLIRGNLRNLPRYFKEGKVDLAIGIGLFDTQTLEWNEGLDILARVRHVLADGGHAIFTSYGPELFNRNHYNRLGFKVEASSRPDLFFTGQKSDVYVVQNQIHEEVDKTITNPLYTESEQWEKYPELMERNKPL